MRECPVSSHNTKLLVPGALAVATNCVGLVVIVSSTLGLLMRTRRNRAWRLITTDRPDKMCNDCVSGAASAGATCCCTGGVGVACDCGAPGGTCGCGRVGAAAGGFCPTAGTENKPRARINAETSRYTSALILPLSSLS